MTATIAGNVPGNFEGIQNNTNPKWWRDAGLKRLVFWQTCILVSQMTVGYDESVTGSFQAMQPWKDAMGNPSSDGVGLITAVIFVGGFVGAFFASPLADRYGRRPSLAFGSFLCIVGAALQSAAQDRGMFIGGRLIIGFGISFTTSAGPSLLNELAHPRMRGQIASMFNVLWYVGSIIASWLTFGTGYLSTSWSWRIPSLVQGAPALFVLIATFFMPESPRYLLSRGRTAEALHVLSTYHANGAPNDPLVTHSISQITAALAVERASKSTTWRRTLSTHPNRRRLGIVAAVAILTLWTGQSAISYYFSPILASVGIASTAQQTGINGGLQIWNLLCAAAGALLADRVGRRPLWLASFGGMLLANVPLTVASACYATRGSVAAAYVTVVWLFLYNAAFNVACNPLLYAYTTEILPYGLRVKGLALQIALGQAALTVNSYVNPIALDRIGYWLFVFYAGMLVIAVGVVWRWFPETKGMSLEELMGLFGEEEKGLGGVEEIVGVEYTGEAGDGVEGAVVVPKGNGSVKGTRKGEQV